MKKCRVTYLQSTWEIINIHESDIIITEYTYSEFIYVTYEEVIIYRIFYILFLKKFL